MLRIKYLSSGLVATAVLNTKIGKAENKIPDVSGLVKKTDFNTKVSDIEGKYFTTCVYNQFKSEMLDRKSKQSNIATNSDLNTVSQGAIKNEEKILKN